jgi:hypothetical protein
LLLVKLENRAPRQVAVPCSKRDVATDAWHSSCVVIVEQAYQIPKADVQLGATA